VQEIKLADGSTVLLNKNSHLDYPAKFTGKTREVYLTGEAYFDIKHDPLTPFPGTCRTNYNTRIRHSIQY
jgi:transmembrane sensor